MLQYLLNLSSIWLVCLLMFDLLLRRESYHAYNRLYLMVTFLLGIVLPLMQWQTGTAKANAAIPDTVERVIAVKQTIVAASTPAESVNWEQYLTMLYFAGVLVSLGLLLVEIVKLVTYYNNGRRTQQAGWVVITTGKDHAPFSFLNLLFVSDTRLYSSDEWDIILMHERRHANLFHFADLLLMQLGRVVFWFHPLVYIYNNRLSMVHEYQADIASAKEPAVYGNFLVEQSLLLSAPSITHSFNRSPIKNRIIMLTRKSTAASKFKMLVFVPLALVSVVCFSKNGFSQAFEQHGNKVSWQGNTFELSDVTYDTMILVDPVNGEQMTKAVKHDPVPVKMNGKQIPAKVDDQPQYKGKDRDLRDYIVRNMKSELSRLDDGKYALDISDVIVDQKGRIVYFHYEDLKRSKTTSDIQLAPSSKTPMSMAPMSPVPSSKGPQLLKATNPAVTVTMQGKTQTLYKNTDPAYFGELTKENQQAIYKKVCELMQDAPAFNPGRLDGKAAIATYFCPRFWNHFEVKDHKVYELDKDGNQTEL